MTLARRAIEDLRWVAAYWPDLAASRLPDVIQTWRTGTLTAEAREERDALARVERYERAEDAPGQTPAPVKVAVLDILSGVLADAYALAFHLAQAAYCPVMEPPSTAFADARPYLARSVALLYALDDAERILDGLTRSRTADDSSATTSEAHRLSETLAWAYRTTRRMIGIVASALGLLYDGQALDVECPWCRGVTPQTPAGGARTWRVRDLLGTKACSHGHPDRRFCDRCPQQVVIVCENDTCEPESKYVGTWWRGHPCWPVTEWEWLAKQVRNDAQMSANSH
ncbi:hypothetical protein [Microtetraspora glauca]|uniref:Uncharacterized protein n=1 Tax=Microtetraspora glauca TaxID=1996 RepID=A0ABV3GA35_MICGL